MLQANGRFYFNRPRKKPTCWWFGTSLVWAIRALKVSKYNDNDPLVDSCVVPRNHRLPGSHQNEQVNSFNNYLKILMDRAEGTTEHKIRRGHKGWWRERNMLIERGGFVVWAAGSPKPIKLVHSCHQSMEGQSLLHSPKVRVRKLGRCCMQMCGCTVA